MSDVHLDVPSFDGVRLDTFPRNFAIKGDARSGKTANALRLVKRMREEGGVEDCRVFTDEAHAPAYRAVVGAERVFTLEPLQRLREILAGRNPWVYKPKMVLVFDEVTCDQDLMRSHDFFDAFARGRFYHIAAVVTFTYDVLEWRMRGVIDFFIFTHTRVDAEIERDYRDLRVSMPLADFESLLRDCAKKHGALAVSRQLDCAYRIYAEEAG